MRWYAELAYGDGTPCLLEVSHRGAKLPSEAVPDTSTNASWAVAGVRDDRTNSRAVMRWGSCIVFIYN